MLMACDMKQFVMFFYSFFKLVPLQESGDVE